MVSERFSIANLYQWLVGALWLSLLIGVPITSFPPLAEAIGGVTVSPFSLIPLTLLIPLFLLPDQWQGGRLPAVVWPLFGFVLAALLSAGLALYLPTAPFKGESLLGRLLHAGATLAVGLGFYLTAIRYPSDERRLKLTLWGLYIGGILALVWATFQANYVMRGLNNVPQELNELHRLISIRDLERNRVTGMAFEPSWFGDQLVILYLPVWVGAVLTGRSLLPWHKGLFSIEFGLSLWAGWLLLMTRSRVSIGALLLGFGIGLLVLFWKLAGWIWSKVRVARSFPDGDAIEVGVRIVFLLVAIGLIVGIGYGLIVRGAEIDWRMRRVATIRAELPGIRQQYPYSAGYEVANRFAFAERLVYWRASLEAFTQKPITGVGLGNAGFLFQEGVPAYGYELTETRAFLDPAEPNFPNPKNLWIRLLSETGIIGTSFFMTWLIFLALSAWQLQNLTDKWMPWVGLSALLSLVMQAVEGFSLDSFALPQLWLMYGLLTGLLLSVDRTMEDVSGPENDGAKYYPFTNR